MAVTQLEPFANFIATALNKEVDLGSDDIRLALVAATYTPDRAAHDYWSDVVANEMAAAGSYVANGVALANKAVAVIAANSWSRAHAVSTAYNLGEMVRPSAGNGFVYRAAIAGTSGGSAPTWPTVIGQTVADGGVTWTCVGRNVFRFNADAATWATILSSSSWRYVVMYDRTPASDATRPLIGIIDHGSTQTGGDAAVTYTPDSAGGYLAIPIP